MKRMIKIINIIFIVIIMYLLIGNLYRGITSPTLIGNPKGHFLGYYFITVAYFCFTHFDVFDKFLFSFKKKGKLNNKKLLYKLELYNSFIFSFFLRIMKK